MTTALDYIKWRGDLSFSAADLCEADIFLCSMLSTPDMERIVPGLDEDGSVSAARAAERFIADYDKGKRRLGMLRAAGVIPMLRLLPGCRRFEELKMSRYTSVYDTQEEKQFAAVSINLPGGETVLAFRGTDDTIVGWKEDFHLAIKDFIPAQESACRYLEGCGGEGDIFVCGHSKGGNLAVYAAVNAPAALRARIKAVYNFDGPGFKEDFFHNEGYGEMRERIRTVVSKNTIIGTLLNTAGEQIVVNTETFGLRAHDAFTWEMTRSGFVRCDGMSDISRAFDIAMDTSLERFDEETKTAFIEQLFDTLSSTGAEKLTDIKSLSVQEQLDLVFGLSRDKIMRQFMQEVAEQMLRAVRKI